MRRRKIANTLGVLITIIILLLLVAFTNNPTNNVSIPERVVGIFVMPIQKGVTYLKNKIKGNEQFFADMDTLTQENKKIQKENEELKKKVSELEITKTENKILKEQMGLVEKYKEYKAVPAEIINKDISNYSNILVINSGSKEGIKANMAVVADVGLVGYIVSVTDDTAKVLTIIDPGNSVSGTLTKTEEGVILRGSLEDSGLLKLSYIPTQTTLSQGDSVETSGLRRNIPKGNSYRNNRKSSKYKK